jgi:hypothetical protein
MYLKTDVALTNIVPSPLKVDMQNDEVDQTTFKSRIEEQRIVNGILLQFLENLTESISNTDAISKCYQDVIYLYYNEMAGSIRNMADSIFAVRELVDTEKKNYDQGFWRK